MIHNHLHDCQQIGVNYMGGSIYFEADRGRWVVSWRAGQDGKAVKIRRYKREFMACTHYDKDGRPDLRRCNGYKTAVKLRSLIQARWERYLDGKCEFRLEEFTGELWSDVIEFYKEWMRDDVVPKRKPATIHCYESYLRNWNDRRTAYADGSRQAGFIAALCRNHPGEKTRIDGTQQTIEAGMKFHNESKRKNVEKISFNCCGIEAAKWFRRPCTAATYLPSLLNFSASYNTPSALSTLKIWPQEYLISVPLKPDITICMRRNLRN
jgi:hypothetical protein